MGVQLSTTDAVPGHGPHWEAGPLKNPPRTDPLGRFRLTNDKVKVDILRAGVGASFRLNGCGFG